VGCVYPVNPSIEAVIGGCSAGFGGIPPVGHHITELRCLVTAFRPSVTSISGGSLSPPTVGAGSAAVAFRHLPLHPIPRVVLVQRLF
jgi:hypothetical protein